MFANLFLRVDQAVKFTQLSRSALVRAVRRKQLKATVIGGRQFFLRPELEQFLRERPIRKDTLPDIA